MYKLNILTFVICCAVVLAVVSAYPSYPLAGDYVGAYQGNEASLKLLRVAREAAADPQRRRYGHGGRGGGSSAGSKSSSASFSKSVSSPSGTFSSSGSQSSSSSFSKSGFRGKG